jgi:hypothetical protein
MRRNSSACVDGAWISIVPLHLRMGRFRARLETSPQLSRASTVVFRYRLRLAVDAYTCWRSMVVFVALMAFALSTLEQRPALKPLTCPPKTVPV